MLETPDMPNLPSQHDVLVAALQSWSDSQSPNKPNESGEPSDWDLLLSTMRGLLFLKQNPLLPEQIVDLLEKYGREFARESDGSISDEDPLVVAIDSLYVQEIQRQLAHAKDKRAAFNDMIQKGYGLSYILQAVSNLENFTDRN